MILLQTKDFERIRCDSCGCTYGWDVRVGKFVEGKDEDWFEIPDFWNRHIFGDLHPQYRRHIKGDFCRACAVRLTPWVYRLHDIAHLEWQLAKLRRAINDHKSKHH